MMNVYLIRHTSVAVPQGTCYGQSDVPVKDSFEEEATAVLRQIKDIRFDKVYCSYSYTKVVFLPFGRIF